MEFLHRLGLDHAADERAIKRAYARELKLIDQEANASGFQILREAYETALHWQKFRPARPNFAPAAVVPINPLLASEPEPLPDVTAVPHAAPPRDAFANIDSHALAEAEFEEFLARSAQVAAHGDERDPGPWRKHLEHSANGERLLNITARAQFEYRIARLLADGWRPGHGGLFTAARQVFAWDRDSRRLMQFGDLGAWINQAIEESSMFANQNSDDCSSQTDALLRLREAANPKTRDLIAYVPHLRNMVARFPAWTTIIASADQIKQWVAQEEAIPAWRRRLYRAPVSARQVGASTGGGSNWWKIMLVLLFIRVLFGAFDSRDDTPVNGAGFRQPGPQLSVEEATADEEAYRRAAGPFYMPPGTRKLDPAVQATQLPPQAFRTSAPAGRGLTDAELKKIFDRVDYKAQHQPGKIKVSFQVELDKDGFLKVLMLERSSGIPELDRKAEKAIRQSAPFGPQIYRKFRLYFSMVFSKPESKMPAPRLPASASELEPEQADPEPIE